MWSLADPVDTPTAPAFWPGQKRIAVSIDELDLSNVSAQLLIVVTCSDGAGEEIAQPECRPSANHSLRWAGHTHGASGSGIGCKADWGRDGRVCCCVQGDGGFYGWS